MLDLRHRLLLLALLLPCCATAPRPQQMPDGTLQVECEGGVSYCTRRAEAFCGNDPVHVLFAGTREGRHGDARYSDGSEIATVQFVCGKGQSVDIRFRKKRNEATPPSSPVPPAAAPANEPVCVAGATQECTGTGACSGGQACLSDGSGWGPCDCGDPPPPSDTEENPASPPSTADTE